MNADRFSSIAGRFPGLRIAVVGDFFLDRYLRIDPSKAETSIETGLPVHNVVEVRAQPGAAGTIVNNLVALGVGEIHAVGFCGDDGEGYELRRALDRLPGVSLDHFLTDASRRTPVYCKPLVIEPGEPPRELNRLDSKNWTPTPEALSLDLAARVLDLAGRVDAILLMDQVDLPQTGVLTSPVREAAYRAISGRDGLVVLADSRRGLNHYPSLVFKMNAAELAAMTGAPSAEMDLATIRARAAEVADRNGRPVFVTLAERGIVGAVPARPPEHVPALPVRGPIDIVGAGDSVTASLAVGLAAGADTVEAMELSMIVASIVIHQLGTTGTASIAEIADQIDLAGPAPSRPEPGA
jgi:rfaE bifunctional protein kinase chain/domain